MEHLHHSLGTLKDNLAADEALLIGREENPALGNILRTWSMDRVAVAMGSGGKLMEEVNYPVCRAEGVEMQRRSSGGGTVLLGPGCLLFSLVMDLELDPSLATVHSSYERILEPLAQALSRPDREVRRQGICDLAVGELKVSGNAQQRKRRFVLHHGTLLLDMDLGLLPRYLPEPPRQPEYRLGRPHGEFTLNLGLSQEEAIALLRQVYGATSPGQPPEPDLVTRSLTDRFNDPTWLSRR